MTSSITAAVQLLAYTPIVMTGTFTSHPDPAYVGMAMNQFVVPSHSVDYPPTTYTPEQAWPITGLFDYTFGTSVQIGLHDLQRHAPRRRSSPAVSRSSCSATRRARSSPSWRNAGWRRCIGLLPKGIQ